MSMNSNDGFRNYRKRNRELVNINGKRLLKADGSQRIYKHNADTIDSSFDNNHSELVELAASRRSSKMTNNMKSQDDDD